MQGFPSVVFDGFARPYPTIKANGVVDAATQSVGQEDSRRARTSRFTDTDLSDALPGGADAVPAGIAFRVSASASMPTASACRDTCTSSARDR